MLAHKADLLRVLERPEVPLHNNGSESIIRGSLNTREISGSTRSEARRCYRDSFTGFKKRCWNLGASFWDDVRDRLLWAWRQSPGWLPSSSIAQPRPVPPDLEKPCPPSGKLGAAITHQRIHREPSAEPPTALGYRQVQLPRVIEKSPSTFPNSNSVWVPGVWEP